MSSPPPKPDPKWHPTSPALTPDSFADIIEGQNIVIHFWAPWNPYDRPLDANLQALPADLTKKFRFFSVNTDDTAFTTITEAHNIAALPTLLCFTNARPRGRFHGLQTAEALQQFLEEMSQPQRR